MQKSEFDFISILIWIIVGLGVTNLLSGAGRVFYRRRKNPIDEVHIVLTGMLDLWQCTRVETDPGSPKAPPPPADIAVRWGVDWWSPSPAGAFR